MKQWMLILIMVLFIPTVYGDIDVQISLDNITWQNISLKGGTIDETNNKANSLSLDPVTLYYFRLRNETNDWIYLSQRTKAGGENVMASMAIVAFVSLITLGIFLLPRLIRFSKDEIINTLGNGLCIVLGLYLLLLDITIVVTISDTFGLGVNRELFRWMWLIEWASYFAMVIVTLSFLFKMIKMWQTKKYLKRMGYG